MICSDAATGQTVAWEDVWGQSSPGSMKSVSPYSVLGVPIMRQAVHECFVRHCLVEGCIKYTDLQAENSDTIMGCMTRYAGVCLHCCADTLHTELCLPNS